MEWLGKELDLVGAPLPTWSHQHESHFAWVFHNDRIGSINSEDEAAYLAYIYPEAIYFLADTVPHPNNFND